MGHALCLSAEQTSGPLYERRYPGLFLGEVTRFMSQGRHYGCCLRGDDRSLSEGRWLGLCHRGDPQVSEKRLSLCLGESPSLYMIEVSLVSVWGETLESLSERRHPGPFLRRGTQVSDWGEKPFSWRGNALVFLWVTLISFGEEMLWFLWEEMPISVQGQMPWFLSEGGCPTLCLRTAAFVLVWEETPWSLRMDTLLSVWENALVPFWGETPWSFSEKSCPGLGLRGEAMVLVWWEILWSLKVELGSFSKRNPSGLCQEETLWSSCERRTLVSVSGEML